MIRDVDGQDWWTTDEAVQQLAVDRKRINDWVRRGLVNPPVKLDGRWWYRAQELLDAEHSTRVTLQVHGGPPRRATTAS